jgi:C4-dicarboxylate transporter DctM subunit
MTEVLLFLGLAFVALLAIGMPIAHAIGLTAIGYFVIFHDGGSGLETLPQTMSTATASFSLAAIPFFVFVGELMGQTGIADRMVWLARTLIGHLRGGLAMVSLVASLMVAAFSGSSVANAVSTGTVTIPAMEKAGYPRQFAAAVEASSSSLGSVVPPSVAMIAYCSITGVSVNALFVAGYVPAVLYALGFLVVISLLARKGRFGRDERSSLRDRLRALGNAIGPLLIPVIVMGGILSGIMTATEAGAIAGAYTLVLALCYRTLTWRRLFDVLVRTAKTTGVVMIVVAVAAALGWILSFERVPTALAEATLGTVTDPTVILVLVVIVLVLLGTFMETLSALAITAPVLMGIGAGAGIDPLLLGLLAVLSLSIGMITPPVGVVLFVTTRIAGTTIEKTSVALLPFLAVLIGGTLLLALFPELGLWLPNLLT